MCERCEIRRHHSNKRRQSAVLVHLKISFDINHMDSLLCLHLPVEPLLGEMILGQDITGQWSKPRISERQTVNAWKSSSKSTTITSSRSLWYGMAPNHSLGQARKEDHAGNFVFRDDLMSILLLRLTRLKSVLPPDKIQRRRWCGDDDFPYERDGAPSLLRARRCFPSNPKK